MLSSKTVLSEVLHILFPILAVYFQNPLFTIYALFEIAFWEGSRTVTDAIVINLGKLMRALILGLLLMYTWMILGIFLFWPIHEDDLCSNMFQCFWAYLGKTIRDNGVFEVLQEPQYPHNIADAVFGKDLFLYRFVFDLVFQIVFIYILLAMITGIVIDAFSEMQALKVSKEEVKPKPPRLQHRAIPLLLSPSAVCVCSMRVRLIYGYLLGVRSVLWVM